MRFLTLPNGLLLEVAKNLNLYDLASLIRTYPHLYRLLISLLESPLAKRRDHPLSWAVCWGDVDLIKIFLDNGMDIEATCEGITALHLAIYMGKIAAAKLLVDYGCSIYPTVDVGLQYFYSGSTILHAAACTKPENEKMLQFVLDLGISIDIVDNSGRTALHMAAREGHAIITRILLQSGADHGIHDSNGCTALSLAAQEHRWSTIRVLLKGGANINSQSDGGYTALHLAVLSAMGMDFENFYEVVRLLLEEADINAQDNTGKIAFHIAVGKPNDKPESLIRNSLLNLGAGIFAQDNSRITLLEEADVSGSGNGYD